MPQKFIFITGGVMSGLGKGITTSSIGRLLISKGYSVTAMKIDPYINIDAGTMRPTEHGEVFVTKDGGEIDQDLGNYERFLNIELTKEHNLTTGKVYKRVIEKERQGDYLGKTVQPIPHVTNEIKETIKKNIEDKEILLIEIGGTVGDYENVLFLEAARQMRLELGKENVLYVHVTFLPKPPSIGEAKTKPTQHSVKELNRAGIQPDFLICRTTRGGLDEVRKEKLSLFCNLSKEDIIENPDVETIYEVPLLFDKQNLGEKILKKLNLKPKGNSLYPWQEIVEKIKNPEKEVKIGMVGKYLKTGEGQLIDSYISVNEAIKHAAGELGAKAKIKWISAKEIEDNPEKLNELKELDAVIVPGGFGKTGIEGKIKAIEYCRENNIPYLGLCLGLQLAVIEFARNKCGLKEANSTEFNENTPYPVIDFLPEQREIMKKGGTMRLGEYVAVLKENTKVHELYSIMRRLEEGNKVRERHRHRYEVNPEYHEILTENGLVISGASPDGKLVEFIELPGHKFFVATQAHPEFTSKPGKPNPLFYGLVKAALN